MASAQTIEHLKANLKVTHYDFDPDVDTKVDAGWVDMRDFTHILMSFFRTVGTSNLDTFRVLANDQADGSGTDVEVVAHAVASEPNAVGDYMFVEVSDTMIREVCDAAGVDGRYVSLQLEFATGTDEGVVTYIRSGARFPQTGLTANNIA